MKKQRKIQLALVSIGVLLILLTYFYYPYITQDKLQNDQLVEKDSEKTIDNTRSTTFENVEYEPEAFPGLVYRMDDPKVVLLLFGSGKMVCVGAREVNDIKNAVRNIKEELTTAGLMRT